MIEGGAEFDADDEPNFNRVDGVVASVEAGAARPEGSREGRPSGGGGDRDRNRRRRGRGGPVVAQAAVGRSRWWPFRRRRGRTRKKVEQLSVVSRQFSVKAKGRSDAAFFYWADCQNDNQNDKRLKMPSGICWTAVMR